MGEKERIAHGIINC